MRSCFVKVRMIGGEELGHSVSPAAAPRPHLIVTSSLYAAAFEPVLTTTT